MTYFIVLVIGFLAGIAAGMFDRPPHDGVPQWQDDEDHDDPHHGSGRREEDDL